MTDYILHAIGAAIAAVTIGMMFNGYHGPIATGLLAVGLLACAAGVIDREEPVSARELAKEFSWTKVKKEDLCLGKDIRN